jgi:hypothetical protein
MTSFNRMRRMRRMRQMKGPRLRGDDRNVRAVEIEAFLIGNGNDTLALIEKATATLPDRRVAAMARPDPFAR